MVTVTLFCKSGRWFFAPTVGNLDQMRGYRARSDSACATIVPAVKLPNIGTVVVVVVFHIKNRSDLYPVPFSFLLFKAKKRISVVTG